MGSERTGDEQPIHEVRLARPFAVGRFEVTFAEWDACVAAGGCGQNSASGARAPSAPARRPDAASAAPRVSAPRAAVAASAPSSP
ncbi:MAG: SUMF1/EgtB/PvdO family nonheme iron enzyme [Acetobacteraceae bacterium]